MSALLEVSDLTVRLKMDSGAREVITGTSFTIGAGEAMGLVGESGSGKSMTAKAIARLLPKGAETLGGVTFDGVDVLALDDEALRKHRAQVSVIFQDPRAHINPVRRINDFMTESLRLLDNVPKAEVQPAPRPRRRVHHRARRHDPGRGHGDPRRPAPRPRTLDAVHHPRPRARRSGL